MQKYEDLSPVKRDYIVAERLMKLSLPAWHLKVMPAYTQNLDAAWQVLQYMSHHEFNELRSSFAYHLNIRYSTSEGFDTFQAGLDQLASWTPDHICLAALRTLGIVNGQGEIVEAQEA